ncbi:MAG: TldD/PmbA family protein [Methylotenera sp.]|nr:TldD/PmbA family protein [Oligoflexia bacterium]
MHSHIHGHPALLQAVRKLEQMNPDKFELYFLRKTSTRIDSKNGEVDSLSRSEDVGLSVRLIRDQRMGFSFTTSLEKDAIDRAIQAALDIAAVMPADPFVDLHPFGSSVYPAVDHYDTRGLATPIEQKIALAHELEAQCRRADKRITGIRAASLSETAYEIHMLDSNSEHIQHQSTLFSASITCKAEQDGDSQMGGEFDFSNYLDNLNTANVGKLAAQWATELLGAKPCPTLKCPAIIRNDVVAQLLEFISGSFSAEEIDKGRSMLAGKEGTRIFSERLTLVDDGLLPGGYATSPFDGEGVPSSHTTLVDGGFFSGILYDSYHARKKGTDSTGNATRGIKGPPSIGPTNLYLNKGKKSLAELQAGITKGILITDLMGVHTANSVTGEFSLGASGILIENGVLTHPVKGFAVAGNVLDIFRHLTDIGSDLRFFGNIGTASISIPELSVSGT